MHSINEKNLKIICLVVGVFILCASLVACGVSLDDGEYVQEITSESDSIVTEEATSTPEVEIIVGEDEIPEEAETQDIADHKLTLSDLDIGDTSWAYFIVNRTNYLPKDYENNLNFKGVWSNGRYYYFDERIADFAECMINDAERDGVTLLICSAYRSHSAQTANFESQVKAYAKAKYSFADAYTYTSRYIAIPGTSEHQTGLAVDFITPGYMYLDDGFENTEAYKWLSENSYKYGFILRYPSSKANETGINYEPWHFRFIGFECAEDIYNSGLCLEEYMTGEGSVTFNPMAPLQIPVEPAWYQSYINPPEPETEESTDEISSETDTDGVPTVDESEADTSQGDEIDEEELPDWLQTESEITDGESSDAEEFDSAEDTEEEELQNSDEKSSEDVTDEEVTDDETTEEATIEEETDEELTSEEDTEENISEETTVEEETPTEEAVTEEETTTEEVVSEENTEFSQDEAQEEE